ncbi:peptide ABC transporter substrate-binding protein [Halieaceae bacterium IMCC14734]|uniref:Peptide ABC transporter substrate-binding protein n=1 Tax=Candidatus Litorirhabdus singularis TaxID=2518993 RepID=A0ABT3TE06_9GAMM|nr:peptide ABC transporter substrate-binding protein [Candidatus Litorirhabdus singularis]MCX2979649.1 peptide ABC transporter substrate-binding protein [Candidatus Litorirhabdus singularis]
MQKINRGSRFNKSVRVGVLLCLLCTVIVAGGCGSGESNVASGNREGILYWGNGAEPQELDPHIVTGVPEHYILIALLEGLVQKDAATLQPQPAVAERWRLSADGRVYTFTIRASARWSNGDRLTAHDFVWSWMRALTPKLGNAYAYMFNPIVNAQAYATGELTDFSAVGVKALDDLTLQVTLDNPTPYFLQLLDHYSMFPVHRATIEKFGSIGEAGTVWTRAGNYVGNGPFALRQWDLNKKVIVEKNLLYWDAENVRLSGIHYFPTENLTTEERMFRAGQLHRTSEVPVGKLDFYREQQPDSLRIAPYLGTYFYRFNTRLPHLADVRVRKALAMTVDREAIVEHVLRGGQQPAYSITPPDTLGYTASSDLRYDVLAARELLAAAGYPDGAGFPPVDILYNTFEQHRKIAVAIQQMWKQALNIDVTIRNQDWKVYLDTQANGNFQIARAAWIGDYVDPNSFLDMWIADGGNNRTGWSDPDYERLVSDEAPSAGSVEQRYAILGEAESILLDAMPIIPIYHYVSIHLVHPSVKGLPGNLLNNPNFKHIYLQAEPAAP